MFCSNCGKTIPVGSTTCVHCKMVVGSGEFSAASYIASLPETAASSADGEAKTSSTPRFTRTTYTTMEDDGGSDVVRRTTYRPVLEEESETAPEEPGEEEGPAPKDGEEPAPEEKEEEKQEEQPQAPLGDPSTLPESMLAQPLKPVKLPGISAATQERMRRLAEQQEEEAQAPRRSNRPLVPSLFSRSARGEKTRVPKREVLPHDEEEAPEETAAPAEPEEAPAEESAVKEPSYYEEEEDVFDTSDIEEEYEPERRSLASFFRTRGERPALSRSARIGRTVLLAALVVAILIGGFIWLSLRTAAKSPVTGVTASLFERGVALIESHTTQQYRDRIVSTYTDDPTGTAALEMQLKDREEINALLPGTPLANDQEFVDTLLSIQDQIDTAVTLDALNTITGDGTELGGSSAERWSAIRNAVTRLKSASSATDFAAIAQGAVLNVTPTPAPTPTPSPYTTLTKGMNDNEEVRLMQNRLYELGWFNDVRDGDFGAVTQTAIKAFQQASGLSVTGIADPETLAAIYAEDAIRTGNRVTPPPTEAPEGGAAQEQPADTTAPASPASPNH